VGGSAAFAPRSTSRAANGTRLYELRATIEARPMLSEIHDWFTEASTPPANEAATD